VKIRKAAAKYYLLDLISALQYFLSISHLPDPPDVATIHHTVHCPENLTIQPLDFNYINIWNQFCLFNPSLQHPEDEDLVFTIQALPPSKELPMGRCNITLIEDTEEAQDTGLTGLYHSSPCIPH